MLVVKTACKSRKEAEAIAGKLVKGKLAACARIYPCKSIFFWNGRLRREREFALELKIRNREYSRVEKRIKGLHSYSLPEISAYKPARASREYAAWVERSGRR